MTLTPFSIVRRIASRRTLTIVLGVGLFVAVAAGGLVTFGVLGDNYDAPDEPRDPTNPDDPYYTTPQVPDNPNHQFHDEDPRDTAYPADWTSWEDRVLWSTGVQSHLFTEIRDTRRYDERVHALRYDRSMMSHARIHSVDMAINGYLADSRSDTEPIDRYEDVKVLECDDVAAVVAMVEVTPDELEALDEAEYDYDSDANEQYVADLLFDELRAGDDGRLLMSEGFEAYGVGVYLNPVEDENTTVIEAYATVDLCSGYEVVKPGSSVFFD